MEDNIIDTEGANFTRGFVINNKEMIVDFFGDNRDWYKRLTNGGSTYRKTSLDMVDGFDEDGLNHDDNDIAPLDVSRLTEERATQVESFFNVYPEARKAFIEYLKQNSLR